MERPLWVPSAERIANANMTRYRGWLKEMHGLSFPDYDAMWHWSIDDRVAFWASIWDHFGVLSSAGADEVLVDGDDMMSSRWFVGSRLNFAENLLRYALGGPTPNGIAERGTPDGHVRPRPFDPAAREAIVFTAEPGWRRSITYTDLLLDVARCARALQEAGVGKGDRVGAFMPNVIETVVAMLATTSLGAIWSSCSPDFGTTGVLDRFGQIEPRVLFAADGYFHNGRAFDSLGRVAEMAGGLPTVEKVVIVPYASLGEDGKGERRPDIAGLDKAIHWDDFLGDGAVGDIGFEQTEFDHPVYIMYSSGTTGLPKSIVHGAGGTLLQHMKELALHTDIGEEDRVFYYTTCGWMMWNWLVSALSLGATLLLFDGNPFHPAPGRLFQMADQERMTVFGTSARYIASVEKAGLRPVEEHDLSTMKAMTSTGSPLPPESFEFVYRHIKKDVQLASIAGGTDLISCFALGDPTGPVWRSELQVRGLGMAVDAFDGDGRSVRGTQGELVCTRSFPSQPVGFWNDPGDRKYRSTYFEEYPNVWYHGDFVEITEHGGVIFYGRSDATLKPGGVRIGTSEIYRPVELIDGIVDSVVIGQEWQGDTRIVLFVQLRGGLVLDDTLRERIRTTIRKNATPRHVPAVILQVPDVPRTINGKKVELAVRNVVHGRAVRNRDALANPEALEHFRDRPELMS